MPTPFATIAASDVDADSPITDTLMSTIRTNFDDHESRISDIEYIYTAGGDCILSQSGGDDITDNNTSYEKKIEWCMPSAGSVRVYFGFRSEGSWVRAKVYINGVAVGTQRAKQAGFTYYSEDFSGLVAGDTLEIWAFTDSSSYSFHIESAALLITTEEQAIPIRNMVRYPETI